MAFFIEQIFLTAKFLQNFYMKNLGLNPDPDSVNIDGSETLLRSWVQPVPTEHRVPEKFIFRIPNFISVFQLPSNAS
jgi:hypothetical protein